MLQKSMKVLNRMILDISDKGFKSIMGSTDLALPKKRKENCFLKDLTILFAKYEDLLRNADSTVTAGVSIRFDEIKDICDRICKIVDAYLSGFPSKAYNRLVRLMRRYYIKSQYQLKVYQKTNTCGLSGRAEEDSLSFFRVRDKIESFDRVELFHVPKEKRSIIGASRYSISGYPSLYLSTSLELSYNELGGPNCGYASLFKLNRSISDNMIKVIELAIKPQDFIGESALRYNEDKRGSRKFTVLYSRFFDKSFQATYLYWYPLIAACSYIRASVDNKFNAEYIVPQLLMQWVCKNSKNDLCGIRYFSCRDEASSEMGFNYVFPVNNFSFKASANNMHYCSILQKAFSLSSPRIIDEDLSIIQKELIADDCQVIRIDGCIDNN